MNTKFTPTHNNFNWTIYMHLRN